MRVAGRAIEIEIVVVVVILGLLLGSTYLGSGVQSSLAPVERQISKASRATSPSARALKTMHVVYNRPPSLAYKKSATFGLVITAKELEAARARIAPYPGETVEATAALGPEVKATLTGAPDEVTVTARTPETRNVTLGPITTWTWTVTPISPGPIELEYAIYSVRKAGGREELIEGPVYSDRFTVEIEPQDRLIHWIEHTDPIWKWLGGLAALIGGGGLIGWRKLGRGKPPGED